MTQKFTQNLLCDAATKVLKNAGDLLKDAELLWLNGRIPRAYSLFHLAIEETAKAGMILQFLILEDVNNETKQKEFLKKFENHKAKISGSMSPDFQMAVFLKDKELLNLLHEKLQNISKINEAKNHSLYVSYIGNKFQSPSDIITDFKVNTIRTEALFRYKFVQALVKISLPRINEIKAAGANIDPEEIFKNSVEEMKSIINSTESKP